MLIPAPTPAPTPACATSDHDLLAAVLAGDRRGRAEFVARYHRLIASCVLKVLRRYGVAHAPHDTEDLCADAWLQLWRDDMRRLRQFRPERGARLASWIGLIVTNATIDHLRARVATSLPLDAVDESALVAAESTDRDLLRRERTRFARAALDRLSAEERAFAVDCFHDERAPEELARAAGISINTVYSRKFKLREKLQRLVSAMEELPLAA